MFWQFPDLKDVVKKDHDWLYFVLWCIINIGGMVLVALIEGS